MKVDDQRHVHVHPDVDAKLEVHAAEAFREIWDKHADKSGAPHTRFATPAMIMRAIKERFMREVPDVEHPRVIVTVNADLTGLRHRADAEGVTCEGRRTGFA